LDSRQHHCRPSHNPVDSLEVPQVFFQSVHRDLLKVTAVDPEDAASSRLVVLEVPDLLRIHEIIRHTATCQ
jgi:hypothetical protein